MEVRISEIIVGQRKRPLRDVSELARSIAEVGLLQPIVVTEDLRLLAGWHRLEACKRLGWETIPAMVVSLGDLQAELAEIDENLIRNELTALERAEHLARRKEIYEALHPETKRGVAGAEARWHASETVSFASDTAAKTGLTPRTIQQDVQIATRIIPEVRDMIRDTPLADSKRDLLALAREDPADQRRIVRRILAGKAVTVEEAREPYRILPPLTDAEYAALKASIAKRGVLVPVEYDEEGNILDGHHRVQACRELGITNWPCFVRGGMTEDEKIEHVLKLNLLRKHLEPEEREELFKAWQATLKQTEGG